MLDEGQITLKRREFQNELRSKLGQCFRALNDDPATRRIMSDVAFDCLMFIIMCFENDKKMALKVWDEFYKSGKDYLNKEFNTIIKH